MQHEEFLTVDEACAQELNWLTPGAVRKLITRRKIPFRKPGGRLVLLRSEIRAWVKSAPGVKPDQI
ncbi:MAG: helix-turn-helix domain-containing protein [Desulfosalsimonadaceae bacterium]